MQRNKTGSTGEHRGEERCATAGDRRRGCFSQLQAVLAPFHCAPGRTGLDWNLLVFPERELPGLGRVVSAGHPDGPLVFYVKV